jgi:hypothetical protein
MRRILLIGGVWMLVLGSVGAVALTASAGGGDQGEADQGGTDQGAVQGEQREDAGVHGGPIERFHLSRGCDLVGLAGLPGNWTHGDYVTAVDALGDASLMVEAAHSDCGKPLKSVDHHGGGPPAHALEHASKGLEKARDAKHAAAEDPAEAQENSGSS